MPFQCVNLRLKTIAQGALKIKIHQLLAFQVGNLRKRQTN